MAKIISASINLSMIDKSKIIVGKDGISKYYNITIFCNDDFDQFKNDVSIIEQQTKEQVAEKAKKKYLGSGRTFWTNEKPKEEPEQNNVGTSQVGDLPF